MSSLMSSGGVRVPDPVPSGTIINATIKLRKNSLASFLYLQHALFLAHQAQLKTMFDSEYGGNIDLTSTPWATYVFWNGGAAAYNLHFKKEPGRVSPDSRITELFGHTPSKLSSVELGKYYRDDIPPPINPTDPKPEEVISRSALCNAVQFKYLIDAITPWFNP